MATKVDPEIVAGFVREVEGYLPKLGESLEAYRENPANIEPLEEAFRMAHCIRGAGSTLGLLALSQIARFEEDTLERIVNGEMPWSEDAGSVLDSTRGTIARYLEGMQSGHIAEQELLAETVYAYRRLRNQPEAGDEEELLAILRKIGVEPAVEEPMFAPEAPVFKPAGEVDRVNVDDELWEIFRQEAEEHFVHVEGSLARLRQSTWDREALQTIRRSIHTLKGACGIVGPPRFFRYSSNVAERMMPRSAPASLAFRLWCSCVQATG